MCGLPPSERYATAVSSWPRRRPGVQSSIALCLSFVVSCRARALICGRMSLFQASHFAAPSTESMGDSFARADPGPCPWPLICFASPEAFAFAFSPLCALSRRRLEARMFSASSAMPRRSSSSEKSSRPCCSPLPRPSLPRPLPGRSDRSSWSVGSSLASAPGSSGTSSLFGGSIFGQVSLPSSSLSFGPAFAPMSAR